MSVALMVEIAAQVSEFVLDGLANRAGVAAFAKG